MTTQPIHRMRITPRDRMIIDYAAEVFSPVKADNGTSNNSRKLSAKPHSDCGVSFISPPAKPDRRLGNESRSTNPDRDASKPLVVPAEARLTSLQTEVGFDKVRSTPIQFASRLLLPRWQIGSPLTPCRTSHRLRGFRPLSKDAS